MRVSAAFNGADYKRPERYGWLLEALNAQRHIGLRLLEGHATVGVPTFGAAQFCSGQTRSGAPSAGQKRS